MPVGAGGATPRACVSCVVCESEKPHSVTETVICVCARLVTARVAKLLRFGYFLCFFKTLFSPRSRVTVTLSRFDVLLKFASIDRCHFPLATVTETIINHT